jgi:hypothetical protein
MSLLAVLLVAINSGHLDALCAGWFGTAPASALTAFVFNPLVHLRLVMGKCRERSFRSCCGDGFCRGSRRYCASSNDRPHPRHPATAIVLLVASAALSLVRSGDHRLADALDGLSL